MKPVVAAALAAMTLSCLTPAIAADGLRQSQRLGRGVNIIGWDALWRDSARGNFKDGHFKLIHEAGFSHVRINLHPLRDGKPDAQGELRQGFFTTLDWAIDQALANKLLVVLDVTFHYYDPFAFTHQGTPWTGQRDKTGVVWQGTEGERQAIERDFDSAQAWAGQQNRPIYLGEFGAYEKGDMDSRVRWTAFVARQAEKRGWSWAYWQFAGDFVLFDMASQKWVQPILEALIPPNGTGQ
jgi:aryl-phospho-beta-D-glucosidase BglC (GH1 family)